MKTQTIGILLIGGAAALYFMNQQKAQQAPPPWYNPNNVPPQPPMQNTPAWQQWAAGIIGVYGAVSWLWQPGGPFYKVPTGNVYDSLPNPGQFDWDDPNSLPGGYV